jgi:hypothetical protein
VPSAASALAVAHAAFIIAAERHALINLRRAVA